jgi:hypothetical protein
MPDGLFDADAYIQQTEVVHLLDGTDRVKELTPKTAKRSRPEPPAPIVSDGTWVGLVTTKRMHDFAHMPARAGSITTALCGLSGRPVALPAGSTVNPCATCLHRLPADASAQRNARRA